MCAPPPAGAVEVSGINCWDTRLFGDLQGESGYPPSFACGAVPSEVSGLECLW